MDKQSTYSFGSPKLYHDIVRSTESAIPECHYLSPSISHYILYEGLILEDFMQEAPFPLFTMNYITYEITLLV